MRDEGVRGEEWRGCELRGCKVTEDAMRYAWRSAHALPTVPTTTIDPTHHRPPTHPNPATTPASPHLSISRRIPHRIHILLIRQSVRGAKRRARRAWLGIAPTTLAPILPRPRPVPRVRKPLTAGDEVAGTNCRLPRPPPPLHSRDRVAERGGAWFGGVGVIGAGSGVAGRREELTILAGTLRGGGRGGGGMVRGEGV